MSATTLESAPQSGATANPVHQSPAPANPRPANRKQPAGAEWRPSLRNRTIFERRALGGESLAALALEYKVSHQRIAQIAARVEGWIVAHPDDRLAERMRLRCRLRYEAVYDAAMTGFVASRREEVTLKERKSSRPAPAAAANDSREAQEVVTTVEERIVRQRHGDPRMLATALKAVEKLERLAAAVAEQLRANDEARPADHRAERREAENRAAENREADDQEAAAAEPAARAISSAGDAQTPTNAPAEDVAIGPNSGCDARHTLPPRNDSALPEASLTTADVSVTAGGDGKPGRIAARSRGPVVLIANGGHIEHMRSLAERALPRNSIVALSEEKEVRRWLARPEPDAALIWLEDNLGSSGRSGGPPSGVEWARELAARGADCPVVTGQGERDGESATLQTLREAGLRVEVVRRGGEGWIRRDWLPLVERLVA